MNRDGDLCARPGCYQTMAIHGAGRGCRGFLDRYQMPASSSGLPLLFPLDEHGKRESYMDELTRLRAGIRECRAAMERIEASAVMELENAHDDDPGAATLHAILEIVRAALQEVP